MPAARAMDMEKAIAPLGDSPPKGAQKSNGTKKKAAT